MTFFFFFFTCSSWNVQEVFNLIFIDMYTVIEGREEVKDFYTYAQLVGNSGGPVVTTPNGILDV